MAVQHPLELANGCCDDDGHSLRTGTLWSCVAHIITAVIGSGVLSLAWSTAQLGWIAGPVSLLCFAIITYISAFLLSDCYRSPDPITGTRNYSYMHAVRVNLGKTQTWFCGLLQYVSMYGTGIAYVITTSTSMRLLIWFRYFHVFCLQIYSQPVFAFVEGWSSRKFPSSGFVNNFHSFKLPLIPPLHINLFRLCFRTVYVASTTAIAMAFPYFNQVLGVLGALNFWPLAIYFPVEMYFVQKKIGAWTRKWIVLRTFSFVCLLITIAGLLGSIEGLVSAKLA
ncbi:hypothetical protein POTOM_062070 [Populus tomentosa]|uniref:Amino acid transporter transmembrane domain-containing protein n=1 Tax=Populus tomentosa TaxID=118781 RepID=A0A8X7XRI6_POPTO|nr:hypothetical protein POTOM_062070 [Populus tomentosa]